MENHSDELSGELWLFLLSDKDKLSRRILQKPGCESFTTGTFVSTIVMIAADGGISPSMAQSAQLQQPLMESFTWSTEPAARKICTECVK